MQLLRKQLIKSYQRTYSWILFIMVFIIIGVSWYRLDLIHKRLPKASFVLLSGKILNTEQLYGRVSIIHFWATSCTTCVKEMPRFIKLYEQFKEQGLEIIAVAMSYDPPMYVVNFAETRKLPFKVAMDSSGKVAQAFGHVRLTPTSFLINRRGKIIKQYIGEPEWHAFQDTIKQALQEK